MTITISRNVPIITKGGYKMPPKAAVEGSSRFATPNLFDALEVPRSYQQYRSRFASLPGELRNRIYTFVLDLSKDQDIFAGRRR